MHNSQAQTPGFQFKGWHMLVCMIAFFGIIIAVNVTMAMLASGTWTGLVVKNTYVASQKFNESLEQAKRQKEAGLSSRITYSNDQLTFEILGEDGNALLPVEARVWLGRPAFEQQDCKMVAQCDSRGLCTTDANLAKGVWVLRIEATLADRTYRRDARLKMHSDAKVSVD